MKLAQLLDWIFSLLPFNGNKLKLGALIELVVHIHEMFPAFDVLAYLDFRLGALGLPLFIVGIVHKLVKKFLDSNAPQLLTQSSAKAVAVVDPTSKAPVNPASVSAASKV